MGIIEELLKSFGLNVYIYFEGSMVGIKAEGLKSFSISFINELNRLSHFFYWKKGQLTILLYVVKLMSLKPKGWLEAQLAMLNLIYSLYDSRSYKLDYWVKRLTDIFNRSVKNLPRGTTYITLTKYNKGVSLGKDKSWMVKLPRGLNASPKEKHFFISQYIGNSDKALKAAIKYRNDSLAEYLKNFLS